MIRFDNVVFQYPGASTPAVDRISFELAPGTFHFLCGPSGAGKTTLFRMMYLDLQPTGGSITAFNKSGRRFSRTEVAILRRKMGIVFQDYRLLPHLTVQENVEIPLTLHGQPSAAQLKAVKEILEWVGLGHKLKAMPAELSGGEQQRVAIARAVVNRPKFLIADEPTGNVDALMGRKIMHLFTELHKHGTTVLVATHDRELVKNFGFPTLYLENGKLKV